MDVSPFFSPVFFFFFFFSGAFAGSVPERTHPPKDMSTSVLPGSVGKWVAVFRYSVCVHAGQRAKVSLRAGCQSVRLSVHLFVRVCLCALLALFALLALLACLLACWLAGLLACWLAGLLACLLVCLAACLS